MPVITELARAKINLSLRVLGRRLDGYHELASLVAFAGVSDRLLLDPEGPSVVHVTGPFAPSLAGENLVAVAMARSLEADPYLVGGTLTLEKRLPVAAGIGGGSADAAAVLRLLQRANPNRVPLVDWPSLARRLGADVPVCLHNRAAWMTGVGEDLPPVETFPMLPAVLVNPRVPVPADKTAQVFRRLRAPALGRHATQTVARTPTFADGAALLAFLQTQGNDLSPPAIELVPVIDHVLEMLGGTDGCRLARMSGGGPTCFGLFDTAGAAAEAAAWLTARRPDWWVVATTLS